MLSALLKGHEPIRCWSRVGLVFVDLVRLTGSHDCFVRHHAGIAELPIPSVRIYMSFANGSSL